MAWPGERGCTGDTLGYAAQDDIRLVGIADVPDTLADISIPEAVDKRVREYARIVDDESLVEIYETMFCGVVSKQATSRGTRQIRFFWIGLVSQRAAPRKAVPSVVRNVVIGFRDIPVLSIGNRRSEAETGVVKPVADATVIGVRKAIEISQRRRIGT